MASARTGAPSTTFADAACLWSVDIGGVNLRENTCMSLLLKGCRYSEYIISHCCGCITRPAEFPCGGAQGRGDHGRAGAGVGSNTSWSYSGAA
jgi:hypothetical protein